MESSFSMKSSYNFQSICLVNHAFLKFLWISLWGHLALEKLLNMREIFNSMVKIQIFDENRKESLVNWKWLILEDSNRSFTLLFYTLIRAGIRISNWQVQIFKKCEIFTYCVIRIWCILAFFYKSSKLTGAIAPFAPALTPSLMSRVSKKCTLIFVIFFPGKGSLPVTCVVFMLELHNKKAILQKCSLSRGILSSLDD